MNLKSLFFFLACCFPMVALANRTVGNGGHTVQCQNGSFQVLDAYEARQYGPLTLGAPDVNYKSKVETALAPLQELAPYGYINLKKRVQEFYRSTRFVDTELQPTNDSGPVRIPGTCKLRQLASQENSALPGMRAYFINKSIWSRLSNDDKAALVLHEVFFGLFRVDKKRSETRSTEARTLVAQLLNGNIRSYSKTEYMNFVKELTPVTDFGTGTFFSVYFGSIIHLGEFSTDANRRRVELLNVKEETRLPVYVNENVTESMSVMGLFYFVNENAEWKILWGKNENNVLDGSIDFQGMRLPVSACMSSTGLGNEFKLKTPATIRMFNQNVNNVISVSSPSKYSNVIRLWLSQDSSANIVTSIGTLPIRSESWYGIEFLPSGQFFQGKLAADTNVHLGNGLGGTVAKNWTIHFHPNGALQKARVLPGFQVRAKNGEIVKANGQYVTDMYFDLSGYVNLCEDCVVENHD